MSGYYLCDGKPPEGCENDGELYIGNAVRHNIKAIAVSEAGQSRPERPEYERRSTMYPNLVAECKGYPLCGVSSDGLAMASNISFHDFNAVLNGDRKLSCAEAQAIANEMNRCRWYRPEITSEYLISPSLTILAAETDEQKAMFHKMRIIVTAFCDEQSFDYSGEGRELIQMMDSSRRRSLRDLSTLFAKALNQAVSCAEFRYMVDCVVWAYHRLLDEYDRQAAQGKAIAEIADLSCAVDYAAAVRFIGGAL